MHANALQSDFRINLYLAGRPAKPALSVLTSSKFVNLNVAMQSAVV